MRSVLHAALGLAGALLAGCGTCLTVPATDMIPPVAAVSLFVDDATGTGVEEFVNTTDHTSAVTVEVPPRRPFTILYSGRDSGGVKRMALDWKYYANNQVVQPLISPDDFSGDSCVTDLRANSVAYPWQNQVRDYEFALTVTDFHDNSATTPTIAVRHGPTDWPLGDGPFRAGFQVVSDIPIDPSVTFGFSTFGGVTFQRPAQNTAIIFYPATADGEDAAFALGSSFPVIVFGHAKRLPFPPNSLCPGAPTDTTQDFRQVSGILAQLARWGFVIVAPDLSWLTTDASPANRKLLLKDALAYLKAENSRAGSRFNGKIKTTGFGAMGHSTGGTATIFLGTSGLVPIDAMGLIAPTAATASEVAEIGNFAPKPVLILHGTQDTGEFGADDQPTHIYDAAAATKHLVTIGGANHFGYTDAICIPPTGDGTATITQRNQQRIAIAYLTAFFRRYLGGFVGMDDYVTGLRNVQGLEPFDITVKFER